MQARVIKPGEVLNLSAGQSQSSQPKPTTAEADVPTKIKREASPELIELGRHEQRVKEYRIAWLPAGQSLADISDRKLYALRGENNFARYVKKHCSVSSRHAGDLMRGAKIAENVRDVSHSLTLLAILQLGRLDKAEDQAKCLSEAIAANGGGRSPTARQIAEAVDARIGARKKRSHKGLKRFNLVSGTLTIKPSGVIELKPRKRGIDRLVLIQEALAKLTSPPQADAA